MAPIKSLLLSVLLLPTLSLATNSAVLDLIPDNFDSVVLSKTAPKPALVEFFAPWCGHCKTLAPVYEELGQAFAPLASKVSIARVDADAEKSLGKRFGVQGFPTLKWFDGVSDKPEDYEGGRDLESLTTFIEGKLGVKAKKPRAPDSAVTMLTDTTFKQEIGADRDVLVAFTAPWCGHCKTLAPVWEQLASSFAPESSSVLIAKVDAEAENAKKTANEQFVTGFPTIKFFPKGSTDAEDYPGPRTEEAFIAFLNEKTGTHRVVGGGLDAKAGTIEVLDTLVAKFTAGGAATLATVAQEVTKAAKGLSDAAAAYYVKVFAKLAQNEQYAAKELKRLEGIVAKGGLAPTKVDEITKKINVLRNFVAKKVEEAGEKVKEAGEKAEAKDEL